MPLSRSRVGLCLALLCGGAVARADDAVGILRVDVASNGTVAVAVPFEPLAADDASAAPAARVMAVQLCGERKVATSRSLLKRLADDPNENAVVRKLACHALLDEPFREGQTPLVE